MRVGVLCLGYIDFRTDYTVSECIVGSERFGQARFTPGLDLRSVCTEGVDYAIEDSIRDTNSIRTASIGCAQLAPLCATSGTQLMYTLFTHRRRHIKHLICAGESSIQAW